MAIEPNFIQLNPSFAYGIMPGVPDTSQRIADGASNTTWTAILEDEFGNAGVLYVCVEGELLIARTWTGSAPTGADKPSFLASNGVPLLIRKQKNETWWYQAASSTANRSRGGMACFYESLE